MRALECLLATKASHIGLLEFDWSVLSRFLPTAYAPKFSELARKDDNGTRGNEPVHDLRRRLAQLQENELLPALIDVVRSQIAQILRIAPERIDAGTSLFDMGMDSLMAVELAVSIETRLGVQLSALSLGDGPTIERIAGRVARQLRPDDDLAGGSGDVTAQVRLEVARHATEMSEQEATQIGAEISRNAPISLTRGHRS